MAPWHAISPLDEVAQGITEWALGDELVLLIRQGDALQACAAICPHKFTSLTGGVLENGCITCPLHNASFDLQSGRPQPDQDWAGHLPVYAVRVHAGVVEVQTNL